jgi:hypothetical protein
MVKKIVITIWKVIHTWIQPGVFSITDKHWFKLQTSNSPNGRCSMEFPKAEHKGTQA